MARSPYGDVEISITGLLSQAEAEAWVEDNKRQLSHYTDDDTPWSINETVKMHPLTMMWSATIKAMR